MDFDVSKENIQPLRGGRNVTQLGVALQAQTNQEYQRELMQQREEFENLIKNYAGEDPLENWYNYVSWVEQSYPKHGHEGNLITLLEHCLGKFENDSRYTHDRRFCKLWIKYIDLQQCPIELYHMMYAKGLCRGCADLYRAWAYYHEAAGDFQSANNVFECGKRELAQPYEDLESAHKTLIMAAGQHMLYGPNEQHLVEKRQALTSLQTFRSGQVGSVRVYNNTGPGILPGSSQHGNSNAVIQCYEDENGVIRQGAEAAPISILTVAKRQEITKENTLKPGPWTTVPVKKRHTTQKTTPFVVHEDSDDDVQIVESDDIPMSSNNNARNNVRLSFPPQCLEDHSNWVTRLTIYEPKDDRVRPMYPKEKVYKEINTEYCIEEIRAERYLPSKGSEIAPIETVNAIRSILQESMNHSKTNEQGSHNNSYKQEFNKSANFPSAPFGNENEVIEIPNSPEPTGWAQEAQPGFNGGAVHSDANQPPNSNISNFDIWNSSSKHEDSEVSVMVAPKKSITKFSIYEQSNLGMQEEVEPKGSAMKTPFKDLNAEELAETGSRGGMDVAAAAPVDSAKRLPLYDDESSSPFEKGRGGDTVNFGDISCNTQMFNFNLNVMQVSTPQNKHNFVAQDSPKSTRKQLFSETESVEMKPAAERTENKEQALSIIFEETKSYRSSSSSGAMTKSSICSNNTKPSNIATISEEHNSYLAQNLKANAALRSSLLGDLMNFDTSQTECIPETPPSVIRVIPAPSNISPIDFVPSDPFKTSIINQLLERVDFPGPHTMGYIVLSNIPKLVVRKESIAVGSDKYLIEKQLGKGTYGTVFKGTELNTGDPVALKLQKPVNRWEFYICRELQSRLANHPLRERFMDVRIGYFCEQSSLYISEFIPCGSLLDVANTLKQKSGRSMKESLCIYFCLEMLRVVKAMHEVKIIHADIKPDNFLVRPTDDGNIHLQLIDFGCSIDMSLFPSDASFKRRITTEDFVCCEMLDGRAWNYHTDLFCIAATGHVLLFDKYIQMQKKDGHWSISQKLQRYMRVDLWNMFFSSLLNQQSGPADTLPLEAMLEDSLKQKPDDLHIDMRYLLNVLRNR